ncbi:MAG: ATP-binding protein, partial [Pseudohongiella sp.]|nr:ATP-binding protein [Pseudohongiella sp.]
DLQWQQDARLADCLVNARQSSAVSRTLREAFSNLFKHACASRVMVELTINADAQLTYTVNDNGVGMVSNSRPGRGLVNMQNRIRELGGSMTFGSPPSRGTTLVFTLPLDSQETADSFGMIGT